MNNSWFFTFGATCEPKGTLMRFGPRWKAEGMDEILDEAFDLTDQISITEYGSDAKIQKWERPGFELDNEAQADYLEQLTEKVKAYSMRTFRTIQGIFCWSDLRGQLEWENGQEVVLGIINYKIDEKTRGFIGWTDTPASEYLSKVYQSKDQEAVSSVS